MLAGGRSVRHRQNANVRAPTHPLHNPRTRGAHTQARFSKYTGSLEWANAVVLWVNVGGPDYTNLFLERGAQMTWYAAFLLTLYLLSTYFLSHAQRWPDPVAMCLRRTSAVPALGGTDRHRPRCAQVRISDVRRKLARGPATPRGS